MDFFAHGFWGFLIFHRFRARWLAVFFALLPDLASWFIFFWYNLFTNAVDWSSGQPDLSGVPGWTWVSYDISHSLVVWIALFFILWLVFRRPVWVCTAGMISIVVDAFTHSREFLPTPFLWPLSGWTFPGFSWGVWWFMLLNYCLLALGYSYIFLYRPWKEQRLLPSQREGGQVKLPGEGARKRVKKKRR